MEEAKAHDIKSSSPSPNTSSSFNSSPKIEDMGKLSIIGCLSFVITFEYF